MTMDGPLLVTPDELQALVAIGTGEAPAVVDAERSLTVRQLIHWTEGECVLTTPVEAMVATVAAPAWALHTAVLRGDEVTETTYCIDADLTVRLTAEGDAWALTPLPTQELVLRIRQDLPFPRSVERSVARVDVDEDVLGSIGDAVARGDLDAAFDLEVAAGLSTSEARDHVAALSAPSLIITVTNGTQVVGWVRDAADGLWSAPISDQAALGEMVTLGSVTLIEALGAVRRLIPGGAEWAHVLVPVGAPAEGTA